MGLFLSWQRESLRSFLRQRNTLVPIAIAVLAVAATWVGVIRIPSYTNQSFVLRYSMYVGTNWLTAAYWFFMVPIVSTLLVLLNCTLAYLVGRNTLLIKYLWLWSAAAVALGFWWLSVLLIWYNI